MLKEIGNVKMIQENKEFEIIEKRWMTLYSK